MTKFGQEEGKGELRTISESSLRNDAHLVVVATKYANLRHEKSEDVDRTCSKKLLVSKENVVLRRRARVSPSS